jgi:hypothetical protein
MRVRTLVACVLVTATLALAQDATKQPPFLHHRHVSIYWYNKVGPEVARDCRGCHSYEGERPRDPQTVCVDCHYGPPGWKMLADPPFESGFESLRRGLFGHKDHLVLACRQCHEPISLEGEGRDHFKGETGTKSCGTCHGAKELPTFELVERSVRNEQGDEVPAARGFDQNRLRKGIVDGLNDSPAMTAENRGPFHHTTVHLLAMSSDDKGRCTPCHVDVPSATATALGAKEFDASACGRCHKTKDGLVTVLTPKRVQSASATALTFAHSDHLRSKASKQIGSNCRSGAFEEIKNGGCRACHVAAAPTSATDFALKDGAKYSACMACHDVKRFKTTNHGDWTACVACHEFDRGPMKSNRPVARVDRTVPGAVAFKMPVQKHVGLAVKPGQDCIGCHLTGVPARPSRIENVRFDHATHLPSSFTPTDCAACHATIDGTARSREIGREWSDAQPASTEAQSILNFDLSACSSCHPGIAVDPASIAKRAARAVSEFSHAAHVGKEREPGRTGSPMQCSMCHPVDADRAGKLVGTLEKAADCTACHLHDEQHARWTGNLQRSDVESCAVCHETGVPKTDGAVAPSLGLVEARLSGPQHHENVACDKCHLGTDSKEFPKIEAVRASRSGKGIHAGEGDKGKCTDCHWGVRKDNVPANEQPSLDKRKEIGWQTALFPGGTRAAEARAKRTPR